MTSVPGQSPVWADRRDLGLAQRRRKSIGASGLHGSIQAMLCKDLRILAALRGRAQQIIDVTDVACREHLDDEYGLLTRRLVARLARKRPSPLVRGDARIWAAGAIYAVGQVNFLFDRTQTPHLTAKQLAEALGVVQTTMANKAGIINRMLGIGIFEPELTRAAMIEQHPMAWLVEVDGFIVDARTLPAELQDEARRRGLIPDLEARRAA